MSELACVFDVGTTRARTFIFDINGKPIAKSYKENTIPIFIILSNIIFKTNIPYKMQKNKLLKNLF